MTLRIDVLTIFPGFFAAPFGEGLLARGIEAGLLDLRAHDLRQWATDRHRSADDEVYGGGAGMCFLAEPIFRGVEELEREGETPRLVYLSPQGRRLDQALVEDLARSPRLLLLAARYEGVDERVLHGLPFEEVAVGDCVVMGGEAPALVLIEAVSRQIPGVVGDPDSVRHDSFVGGLLDPPHYTRPVEVRGMRVPDVLLSGHHEAIRRWRLKESLRATLQKRPDLLARARLGEEERGLLEELLDERAAVREAKRPRGRGGG